MKVRVNSSSAMVATKPSGSIERDAGRRDGDDAGGVRQVAPAMSASGGLSPRARAAGSHRTPASGRQRASASCRPRRGQRAEGQIAAQREHERAERREDAAADVIAAQVQPRLPRSGPRQRRGPLTSHLADRVKARVLYALGVRIPEGLQTRAGRDRPRSWPRFFRLAWTNFSSAAAFFDGVPRWVVMTLAGVPLGANMPTHR